jgi:predicted metal-dependent phosphoesterase TrpH
VSNPAPLRADFHTHSSASDGADAPAELVARARQRGLAVLALTDHDTTFGLPEALAAGRTQQLRVVPGIELSTAVPRGELHILGYGIDPDHAELQQTLAELRSASARRLLDMLDRLRALGMDVPDSAIARDDDARSVGRPHVARAMVARGYASSIRDAFNRFLGDGRPAYVPKDKLAPRAAIRLIRRAGGLAFMAHPGTLPDFEARLPELMDAGLVGMEAYYGEYDDALRAHLVSVATRLGLLISGGSDYHGEHFKSGRELGAVTIPVPIIERFLTALDAR